MALTPVPGQMRQYPGEKFAQVPSPSRRVTRVTVALHDLTEPTQVFADATLVFPLLVAATFARDVEAT